MIFTSIYTEGVVFPQKLAQVADRDQLATMQVMGTWACQRNTQCVECSLAQLQPTGLLPVASSLPRWWPYGMERGREGGRERGREGGREEEKEGGRERGRELQLSFTSLPSLKSFLLWILVTSPLKEIFIIQETRRFLERLLIYHLGNGAQQEYAEVSIILTLLPLAGREH